MPSHRRIKSKKLAAAQQNFIRRLPSVDSARTHPFKLAWGSEDIHHWCKCKNHCLETAGWTMEDLLVFRVKHVNLPKDHGWGYLASFGTRNPGRNEWKFSLPFRKKNISVCKPFFCALFKIIPSTLTRHLHQYGAMEYGDRRGQYPRTASHKINFQPFQRWLEQQKIEMSHYCRHLDQKDFHYLTDIVSFAHLYQVK